MSAISIIRVRIDRLATARRATPQRSRLGAPAAKSLRKAFSADCITSIGMRHNGRYFYALQVIKRIVDLTKCLCPWRAAGAHRPTGRAQSEAGIHVRDLSFASRSLGVGQGA